MKISDKKRARLIVQSKTQEEKNNEESEMQKYLKQECDFENYLELCKERGLIFNVYLYSIENEYMLIDESGMVCSKRYKTITGLKQWLHNRGFNKLAQ